MAYKETKELLEALRAQGWKCSQGKRNHHWKAVPPDPTKPIVIIGSTPSSWRNRANTLRDLKRSGYQPER